MDVKVKQKKTRYYNKCEKSKDFIKLQDTSTKKAIFKRHLKKLKSKQIIRFYA